MSSSSNINLNEKKDDLQESIDDTSDSEFMNMAQKTDDEKIDSSDSQNKEKNQDSDDDNKS